MSNGRLEGMVALVTGAGGGEAGGIGAGISRCLAREGARVAVNGRTMESALATVQQLQALGVEAWPVPADVSDSKQAGIMVDATADHFGQLDILVNNAGVGGNPTAIEHLPDQDWLWMIGINLNGPFFTSRSAVPQMRARGYGRIINIASVAAMRISYIGGAAYCCSKAGLLGLTRHLATEVAQYGITVNAIMPGITLTPLLQNTTTDETRAAITRGIPAQRPADPEEMGYLAAFLASPEAGYITGAAIPVDGGATVLPGDYTAFRRNSGRDTGKISNTQ